MRLKDLRVGMFLEDGFEDLEFWVTVMRLREEGAKVRILVAEKEKTYVGKNGLKAQGTDGYEALAATDFDALVVPGGWAPDKLRRSPKVCGLVKEVHAAGKIVGMICHAGLVGISAGIVKGSRATGSLGIKDDLINAGASWVDDAAFRDGHIVWGRVVDDIPDFCRELINALAERKRA